MTQSDAPNEGREEKTPSSIIDILHAHSINTEFVAAADKWFATSAPLSYFEAAFNMYADNKFKNLRDQLSKEVKMRKELVVGLRKITSTIPNVNNSIELMMWNIANDLISKASELDKNK